MSRPQIEALVKEKRSQEWWFRIMWVIFTLFYYWHLSLFISLLLCLYQVSFFVHASSPWWLCLPVSPYHLLFLLVIPKTKFHFSFCSYYSLLWSLCFPFCKLISEASDQTIFSFQSIGHASDVTGFSAPGAGYPLWSNGLWLAEVRSRGTKHSDCVSLLWIEKEQRVEQEQWYL